MYLLVRCSPLIEQSETALTLILIIGAVTAFFAASVGLFQNDIKKVIAFSTMSQLAPILKFVIQTICEKVISMFNYIITNSQILKTYIHFILIKLVGISEAIRLTLINLFSFSYLSRRIVRC